MFLPRNSVRKKIINGLLRWNPSCLWSRHPLKDAELLVQECQKLFPYVNVLYRNLIEQDSLRHVDMRYRECLSECSYHIAQVLKNWLLKSPYLEQTNKTSYFFDTEQMSYMQGKAQPVIKQGYLDQGRPISLSELSQKNLRLCYPNLFTTNSNVPIELNAFISSWGHPKNTVLMIGEPFIATSYAFIYQKE